MTKKSYLPWAKIQIIVIWVVRTKQRTETEATKIRGKWYKMKVSSDQNHKSRTVVTTTSWHVKIWENVCNILINFSPDIGQITVTPIGQFADHWIMTLTVKVTSFIQSFLPIPHRQRNLNISAQIGSSHDIPPVTLMLVITQLSSCTPRYILKPFWCLISWQWCNLGWI